jgi:hypothetical protein
MCLPQKTIITFPNRQRLPLFLSDEPDQANFVPDPILCVHGQLKVLEV